VLRASGLLAGARFSPELAAQSCIITTALSCASPRGILALAVGLSSGPPQPRGRGGHHWRSASSAVDRFICPSSSLPGLGESKRSIARLERGSPEPASQTIYYYYHCAFLCVAPMPLALARRSERPPLTPWSRGHYWWSASGAVDRFNCSRPKG
jgi:hypothetical protein